MRFTLFLICFLFILLPLQAQFWPGHGNEIRVIQMNGKLGLARPYYPKLVAPPIYDEIKWLSKSSFIIKKGNFYGLMDTNGVEKIKPDTYTHFAEREDLEPGRTLLIFFIYKNEVEQITLADVNGNILARNFYEIKAKREDLMVVTVASTDSIQRELFFEKGEYEKIFKYGILKTDGTWLIKPEFREFNFINDFCIAATENIHPYPANKLTFLNLKGNSIIKEENLSFNYEPYMYDSLQKLKQFCVQNDVTSWFIDSMGTIVAKRPRSSPNLLVVFDSTSKKYGGKLQGKWVIKAQYDGLNTTYNFALAYNKSTNTTDVYDKLGKLLAKTKFNSIYPALNKTPTRNRESKKEILFGQNPKGTFLLNKKFAPISPSGLYGHYIFYSKEDISLLSFNTSNGLYGVMNQKGKIIINPASENHPYSENNLILIKTNNYNSFDAYDLNGALIFSNIYALKTSTLNTSICYGSSGGTETVYSLKDSKVIISGGNYTAFEEIPKYGMVVASKNKEKFIFDKNFKLLSTKSYSMVRQDKSMPVLTTSTNKKQILDLSQYTFSEEFDELFDAFYAPMKEKFMVKSANKYGLINEKGKVLFKCEWDTILFFEKIVVTKTGSKFFLTDTNFILNKNRSADSIRACWENDGIFYKSANKWYYSESPEEVFDQVEECSNKFLPAKKNGKYGVYSLRFKKWIVQPVFDNDVKCVNSYYNPFPVFLTQINGKAQLIDTVTSKKIEPGFDFIEPMHVMIEGSNKYLKNHLVNNGGKKSISTQSAAKTNTLTGGKFGIINSKGELIHDMDADHVITLLDNNSNYFDGYEGPACNVLGFLWNSGGIVEDYVSFMPDSVNQELFDKNGNSYYVKTADKPVFDKKISGGKFGIVGPDGKEILPVIYDKIVFMFNNGDDDKERGFRKCFNDKNFGGPYDKLSLYPVFLKKDKLWGAADLSGKLIIPLEFDSIADASYLNEKMIQVWKNGLYGYFDLFGNTLLSVEYSGEQSFELDNNHEYYQSFSILQKGGSMKSDYSIRRVEQSVFSDSGDETILMVSDTIRRKYFNGGKLGIFDPSSFKALLAPEYDDIRFIQHVSDSNEKVFHRKLSVTQKTKWNLRFNASEQMPYFEIKKSGKWGVYSFKNGIIINPQYDDIAVLSPTIHKSSDYYFGESEEIGAAVAIKFKLFGKWGLLNIKGKIILKAEHDTIDLSGESLYKAVKGGITSYYDADGHPIKINGNPE